MGEGIFFLFFILKRDTEKVFTDFRTNSKVENSSTLKSAYRYKRLVVQI